MFVCCFEKKGRKSFVGKKYRKPARAPFSPLLGSAHLLSFHARASQRPICSPWRTSAPRLLFFVLSQWHAGPTLTQAMMSSSFTSSRRLRPSQRIFPSHDCGRIKDLSPSIACLINFPAPPLSFPSPLTSIRAPRLHWLLAGVPLIRRRHPAIWANLVSSRSRFLVLLLPLFQAKP